MCVRVKKLSAVVSARRFFRERWILSVLNGIQRTQPITVPVETRPIVRFGEGVRALSFSTWKTIS